MNEDGQFEAQRLRGHTGKAIRSIFVAFVVLRFDHAIRVDHQRVVRAQPQVGDVEVFMVNMPIGNPVASMRVTPCCE